MLVHLAIGIAVVAIAVRAPLAQDLAVLDHCKGAETVVETPERQSNPKPGSSTGVMVDVPIGSVCVGAGFVDGQPTYVRQTTVKEGMRIVEVSATPFMPDLPAGVGQSIVRPDQPAGW